MATVALVAAATLAACDDSVPEPTTFEVVVPAGTQQYMDAGGEVDIMPTRIELRVGDTLLIRNEDSVGQSVGPYQVAAGAELRFTYGAPGRYEGYCPLSVGDRYEIIVED